ncbi:NTP/NDP exchange transporter [Lysobacter silvisoli]|uniref:MFS transporter n=1 Tax=Lysobacter silvisoli TaxID=2293254 RepID=A0A371K6H8_9GAMM|nr:MFS transporter [Lysobacter silvisoli]RDZ29468.1 MFS transporter [Lysobacter silvisoli]
MAEGAPAAGQWGRFRAALAESPPLWWSLLYFFSLLCGYYVLRPVRDAMGASGDIETVFPPGLIAWAQGYGFSLKEFTLQVLFTCTFVIMVALQPVYGALVSRFPRRVFLPAVYLIFIACLIGFYWAFHRELPGRGALFFVWTAVFNLFAVTVFWSFMADVFDNEHAKRLYGYIGAGGTVGALLGPVITGSLVGRLGVANLLLVSAGFLCVCLLCILKLRVWAMRRERASGSVNGELAMGGSIVAGLKLVWQVPLLRALAIVMFFGVGVGTLLYNEQAAIVKALYPSAKDATRYYSAIDGAVNLTTIVVQLFVTRYLLRRWGVAPALLVPALAILFGYTLLAMSPLPLLVAIVQVATRAGEFSLAKPGRETLYTRVDRESRYKAKAVVDTVVYRGSDLTFVWLHKALTLLGTRMVFVVGIGVALGMTFGAWRVVRAQRTLPADPVTPGPDR